MNHLLRMNKLFNQHPHPWFQVKSLQDESHHCRISLLISCFSSILHRNPRHHLIKQEQTVKCYPKRYHRNLLAFSIHLLWKHHRVLQNIHVPMDFHTFKSNHHVWLFSQQWFLPSSLYHQKESSFIAMIYIYWILANDSTSSPLLYDL